MTYSTEVLADNPVAYWLFDDASGGVAADEVSTNDGTVVGATVVTDGPGPGITQSMFFDGVDDRVEVGQTDLLVQATAATYEVWISPDSSGTPDGGNFIYNAEPNGSGGDEATFDGGAA